MTGLSKKLIDLKSDVVQLYVLHFWLYMWLGLYEPSSIARNVLSSTTSKKGKLQINL